MSCYNYYIVTFAWSALHTHFCSIGAGITFDDNDLNFLQTFLHDYSDMWYEIGLQIGFRDGELKAITGDKVERKLREMLLKWVHWPTGGHPKPPTLSSLCSALRSPVVGLGNLADKLTEQYSST